MDLNAFVWEKKGNEKITAWRGFLCVSLGRRTKEMSEHVILQGEQKSQEPHQLLRRMKYVRT